jgi:HSP20 family protein
MALVKRKENGNRQLFPWFKNDFLANRFLSPGLFNWDDDFWDGGMKMPPANVTETKNEFNIELSAPGLKREDFKVEVEDGALVISCEKKEESNSEEKNYTRREFSYNSFYRSFPLPENVLEDKINAKYENGMLKVVLPKKEVSISKPKKAIDVG